MKILREFFLCWCVATNIATLWILASHDNRAKDFENHVRVELKYLREVASKF